MPHDTSSYEVSLPQALTVTGISVGFMGLSLLTRELVLSELQAAQRDTSVEYHRHNPGSETAQSLYEEVLVLNSMIVACMKASNELESSNHDTNNEQEGHDTSTCILRSGDIVP